MDVITSNGVGGDDMKAFLVFYRSADGWVSCRVAPELTGELSRETFGALMAVLSSVEIELFTEVADEH